MQQRHFNIGRGKVRVDVDDGPQLCKGALQLLAVLLCEWGASHQIGEARAVERGIKRCGLLPLCARLVVLAFAEEQIAHLLVRAGEFRIKLEGMLEQRSPGRGVVLTDVKGTEFIRHLRRRERASRDASRILRRRWWQDAGGHRKLVGVGVKALVELRNGPEPARQRPSS